MKAARLGATYLGEGRCRFLLWAPSAETVEVRIIAPHERTAVLGKKSHGYHHLLMEDIDPSSRYVYRLHGPATPSRPDNPTERPDPASRFQPQGVHGPSQVVPADFSWQDRSWCGLPLSDYILYELHVGTFSAEGTFDAVVAYLDDLKQLGITAIELMPVAQFPGSRNWGYDGTFPFAAQNSYGGPVGLKNLVNACHLEGLAVVLDVVYNHLGPEGNYLRDFGPYFTDFYRTPWGDAVNFDGPFSREVRHFFIENALFWVTECHIDALRIDAVHAIADFSARPFLEELALAIHHRAEQLNRHIYCIAESALNDTRLIRPRELGGFNLDAQWNDDFHHALHALLTTERCGYYQDFGELEDLAKSWRVGFVYSGEYSTYRRRPHGNSSRNIPARQLIVFSQNHDQVGNRMLGERLSRLVSFEQLKLAAGLVLLSPFIPLLFMGEEYGETAPFQYFVSHSDPQLIDAVRQGRRKEFAAFGWRQEPPDPQNEAVFLQAKLEHSLRKEDRHRDLLAFYGELIRLRKEIPALATLSKKTMEVIDERRQKTLFIHRWSEQDEAGLIFYFGDATGPAEIPLPAGHWQKRLDSAEQRWQGPASAVPVEIDSGGSVSLTLSSSTVLLFVREKELP
jgi:maltooligosyltrehalose trehalohydrolase